MTLGSVIASGGSGIVQAMQRIVASYANASIMAQLYAGVALVELIGGLTGSLAFAGIFDIGLGLTLWWGRDRARYSPAVANCPGVGMPFYTSAVSFFGPHCLALNRSHLAMSAPTRNILTNALQVLFILACLLSFALRTKANPIPFSR